MTDAKAVRFVAVLVVLAGYVCVFRAGESRIGAQQERNAATISRLQTAVRLAAARSHLLQERARLRGRLRQADLPPDRGVLVAHFLRDAARLTSAHHTRITRISGPAAPPVATALRAQSVTGAPPEQSPAPADTVTLEMIVEGRYTGLLATVGALSSGRVPASVDVTSISRKDGAAGSEPSLSAALHVVLERYDASPPRLPGQTRAPL